MMGWRADRAAIRAVAGILYRDPRPVVICRQTTIYLTDGTTVVGVVVHTPTGDEVLGRDGKHYEVAR